MGRKGTGLKAKDYLKQISKINKMIQNKQIEIEQWQSVASGTVAPVAGERVQSSGSQQKMADAINTYIDIQAEVAADINRLADIKKNVIHTIEQLPEAEYDLLHKVYVQFRTLEDIADDDDKSYSCITTIHGRALKHVQDIIDGKE